MSHLSRRTMLFASCAATASLAIPSAAAQESPTLVTEDALAERIEEGLGELFAKAILQDRPGHWVIAPVATNGYGELTSAQLEQIVVGLNDPPKTGGGNKFNPPGGKTTLGTKEYVTCVFKSLVPGDILVSLDYGNIYIWIKRRSWGKLARYMAKHAAKKGIKDLVKLSPAGLAGAILAAAIGCAVWG